MKNQSWQAAIAAAEVDQLQAELRHEADQQLLALSRKHVAFYASRANFSRVEVNEFNRLIGQAYLRLMTSGISHGAFLAFVKQQEALK